VRKPGTAKRFEDLRVYQQARSVTNRVYAATRNAAFARDHSLRDQIRRAAVSTLSNIAEGFERESDKALAQALYIARGSCGEVRAQLSVAFD
jgi:four helix bundle protein